MTLQDKVKKVLKEAGFMERATVTTVVELSSGKIIRRTYSQEGYSIHMGGDCVIVWITGMYRGDQEALKDCVQDHFAKVTVNDDRLYVF